MTILSNKKAKFNYTIIDHYTCGVSLQGSEVVSIKKGEASISESFCFINQNEIFLKNFFVKNNTKYAIKHDELRDKKILLKRKEIDRITSLIKEKKYSLIPIEIIKNEKGLIKLIIGLCRPNKQYDKREILKSKDIERQKRLDLNE